MKKKTWQFQYLAYIFKSVKTTSYCLYILLNGLSVSHNVLQSESAVKIAAPNVGLEPTTLGYPFGSGPLKVQCSTDWANRAHMFVINHKTIIIEISLRIEIFVRILKIRLYCTY